MKKNPLHQAESLIGHYKPLSIEKAYEIAKAFGHEETEILLLERNAITTVRQIYVGTSPLILASSFRIRFRGGPIGSGTWYSGTVTSFVLDCLAVKIQIEGFETARRLLREKFQPCG
jgi:hypothetical protein